MWKFIKRFSEIFSLPDYPCARPLPKDMDGECKRLGITRLELVETYRLEALDNARQQKEFYFNQLPWWYKRFRPLAPHDRMEE